jgi:hypothetical protein
MIVDAAYVIGQAHEVCQDYARSGISVSGNHFGIVCDGCSSSIDSDIGARLVALEAERSIKQSSAGWADDRTLKLEALKIGWSVHTVARLMDLLVESCDTTLLACLVDECGHRRISVLGDGLFAFKENGIVHITSIEYPSGYPAYLNYLRDDKRLARWKTKDVGCEIHNLLLGDGSEGVDILQCQRLNPGRDHLLFTYDYKELDWVLVMSDGMKSFTRRNESGAVEEVPLREVMELFLKFKIFKGRFIQRRLNRFLKDAAKLGWRWADDISVAGVYLGG